MSFFVNAVPPWRRELAQQDQSAPQPRKIREVPKPEAPLDDSDHLARVFAQSSAPSPAPKPPEPQSSAPSPEAPRKKTAPEPSGPWIDYDHANKTLFDQFCRRGGEIYLEARLAVRELGKAARACDVVELIEPKAHLWQRNTWGRQVISEKKVLKMLTGAAEFWIDFFLFGGPPKRPQQHSKFSREAREKGQRTQALRSDRKAVLAQAFRIGGLTAAQIAEALGLGVRQVRNLYKRPVDPRALSKAIKKGVQSVRTLSVQAQNFVQNRGSYRQKRRQPHTGQLVAPAQRPESVPGLRLAAINEAQFVLDVTADQFHRVRDGWRFGDAALDTG